MLTINIYPRFNPCVLTPLARVSTQMCYKQQSNILSINFKTKNKTKHSFLSPIFFLKGINYSCRISNPYTSVSTRNRENTLIESFLSGLNNSFAYHITMSLNKNQKCRAISLPPLFMCHNNSGRSP